MVLFLVMTATFRIKIDKINLERVPAPLEIVELADAATGNSEPLGVIPIV